MSNHNIKSIFSIFTSRKFCNTNPDSLENGFTLVEMAIIAPIVILIIGIFISAIINMTGSVLASRGSNALAYNIQDALTRIDTDVKASGGYLATNTLVLNSPQGYDNQTANFHNAYPANTYPSDSASGTMLILNTYATTANPLSSARSYVYSNNQPYACNSPLISMNPIVMMNIVYFVKNVNGVNSLWRRVVAPSNYASVGCVNGSVGAPWQQPSCAAGYAAGFCMANDEELVDGIQANGFTVNYYTAAAPTTPIANASDNTLSDSVRQTALQTASSIKITINATQTIAGRDVSQTGTIRTVGINNYNQLASTMQPGVTPGAILEFRGIKGNGGISPGINSPLTTTWYDTSGNGNSGTLYNFAGTTTNGWAGSGTVANPYSLVFEGSSDYITTSSLAASSGNFTYEAWIKFTSTSAGLNIISEGGSSGSNPFVQLNTGVSGSDGKIQVQMRNDSGTAANVASTANYNDGNWHHVVGCNDGTNMHLYVDGTEVGTPVAAPAGPYTENQTRIGARGYTTPASYFAGSIAVARIYPFALNASQVATNYDAGPNS